MNPSGLKSMVTCIFSDAKLRTEFTVNPQQVMARFNLNENERKAILTSQTRLGLISGNSIALSDEIGTFESWI